MGKIMSNKHSRPSFHDFSFIFREYNIWESFVGFNRTLNYKHWKYFETYVNTILWSFTFFSIEWLKEEVSTYLRHSQFGRLGLGFGCLKFGWYWKLNAISTIHKRRGYVGQAKYTIMSGTLYSLSLTKSLKRVLFDTEDRSCKNA